MSPRIPCLLTLLPLLASGAGAGAVRQAHGALSLPKGAVKVATLAHRGFKDCIEVVAGKTRLVVVPAWAGRISVLDFGWGNVLWSDPKLDGKVVPPNQEWALWDGNATDIVRSDGKRQWKGLWIHPWPKVEPLDDGVRISSPEKTEANLSARRTYRLTPDGRTLGYNFLISDEGGPPAGWTIWERALVPAGGYLIAPVAKGGAFPNGCAVRDAGVVDPPDRAAAVGDFLVMRAGTRKGVGLAARLRAGWIGSVRDGHALLVTFPIAKEGKTSPAVGPGDRPKIVHPTPQPEIRYAQCGGAHAAFWVAPDQLEFEPLSWEIAGGPGSSYFGQVWHGLDLPAEINRDDPAAVGQWLDKEAAARAKWLDAFPERLYLIEYW